MNLESLKIDIKTLLLDGNLNEQTIDLVFLEHSSKSDIENLEFNSLSLDDEELLNHSKDNETKGGHHG